jgi:hypothetical protein
MRALLWRRVENSLAITLHSSRLADGTTLPATSRCDAHRIDPVTGKAVSLRALLASHVDACMKELGMPQCALPDAIVLLMASGL